jgi:hypothetical protein
MVEVLVRCNLVVRKAFFPAKTLFVAPEDRRLVAEILFRRVAPAWLLVRLPWLLGLLPFSDRRSAMVEHLG